MEPLAYRVRPKTFDDIIGQDHLVGKRGIIRKMIENDRLFSLILYGNAGCGKTTIASIIASYYPLSSASFNASCDSKAKLKDAIESNKMYQNLVLIIDEIHRMNKDVQDYLLPYVENGSVTIIGLTTENPYRVINPAIRSRCHIYRMNEISKADIITLLKNISEKEHYDYITDEIFEYISSVSSCEPRTALNMLEMVSLLDKDNISIESATKLIGIKNRVIDDKGEAFYDIASAMIKSIRGSDPNAAVHYLARLLEGEDLLFITRRIMASAYEDISLANPNATSRAVLACEAALKLGLPEAKLPLSFAVIDLATSPKSNSAYNALNEAVSDLEKIESYKIPPHILNKELKSGKYEYKYPHDYEGGYVKQQYMPDTLLNKVYYNPKDTSSYERAIKEHLAKLGK